MPTLADSEASKPQALSKEVPVSEQPKVLRPFGRLARALGVELLILFLVLLIIGLVSWYATPYYLTKYINKRGAELPDYVCHIDWVHINPWNASIDLETVKLSKKSGKIPVPFYDGPRIHISLQWKQILHGDFRSTITLLKPVVNFVQGPTADQSQTFLEPAWVQAVKQLVPLKINRFEVRQGDVHFFDFHADPKIDLEMNDIELTADNLTNSNHSKAEMPSTVTLTGKPFRKGILDAQLAVNVDLKQPTFSEKVRLDKIFAPDLNAFLAKYGSVYAKSGQLSFYTEMISHHGEFNGYVKPYFEDLQFEPMPKDRDGLAAIWAGIVNGLKDLVENDDKTVATNIPISGRYDDPDIDIWSAAFGIIRNAYLQALAKDFNKPEISPAPVQQAKSQ